MHPCQVGELSNTRRVTLLLRIYLTAGCKVKLLRNKTDASVVYKQQINNHGALFSRTQNRLLISMDEFSLLDSCWTSG